MIGDVVKAMTKSELVLPTKGKKKKKKGSKETDEQRYIVLASSTLEKNDHQEELKNEVENKKIKEKWDQ